MKIKKHHIFLVIFVLLIGLTIFIVSKNTEILGLKGGSDSGPGIVKPDYLMKPIPKINKIKTVVNNPKFKEMKYIKEFFEPIEVESIGKANPFFPYRLDEIPEE